MAAQPNPAKGSRTNGGLTLVRIIAPKPERMLAAVKLLLTYQPKPEAGQ